MAGFFALLVLAACLVARPARAEGPRRPAALSADARAILDALPDACIILGPDGLTVWANRAACEQFPACSTGAPFSFIIRVPELIRAVDRCRESRATERAQWHDKVPTTRWFEAIVVPFARAGRQEATAVFVRDLTEQQRLDRMREDFVANASHELRTPLAALTGYIETLQGPARDDAPARTRFLRTMHAQAERMRRLIDALLSLSRIEMRAHVRPADRVDMAVAVGTAIELTRAMAQEHGVAIETEMGAGPLFVRGDADELVQLVDNLIENAVKYGGGGQRIVVRTFRRETGGNGAAVVEVQDFGKGIAPEHVPRLTERFYRVDVEASRARQGTGLGLAIVKHIVARHRGRLQVRSELGAGSTFAALIPLEAKQEAEQRVALS
ncbi:MAG: ATP-binding protein [Pseudomonadota bacterium]